MLPASCTNSAMLLMPRRARLVGDLADALLVGRILRQVFHEAAVELEEGRIEVRQQLERIQADAELLQPHPATQLGHFRGANSCAARRLVKTLASGNCRTRCSPPTLCAASCSPMKRARLSSVIDAWVIFTSRVVGCPRLQALADDVDRHGRPPSDRFPTAGRALRRSTGS